MDDLTPLLRATFGFASFRPGQAEAIGSLFEGKHTLVVMPTGAGKSLVYQFFAVSRPGVTLVISPLISLMQDQVGALARRGIAATYINSSISSSEQSQRLDAMGDNQYRLVYVAPERLRSTAFQEALARTKLALLAVDEAHCVSQWGHDFRPDYLHIAAARSLWESPLTAALTATATPEVRSDIMKLLGLADATQLVTGFNRPNLTFEVNYCRDAPGKLRSLLELIKSLNGGAAIVYAGTRRDAEEVAQFISEAAGIRADFYHAGMLPEAREKTQERFMRGDTRLVVATNAFGMGIDRADVRLVAHYSIPGSLEAYYQEAGRGGRDGDPARATLLYCPDDRSLQEYFIDHSALSADDVHALHSALDREAWLSNDDVSLATGLDQVAVKVGLSLLESIGAARISGTDGPRAFIHPQPLNESALKTALEQAKARLAHRRAQLGRMVAYAESNSCRRRIILHHFGDPGDISAPACCDNCLAASSAATVTTDPGRSHTDPGRSPNRPETDGGSGGSPCPPKLTPENKTALLILDAVNDVAWPVGRGKIAKLLKGSRGKDVAMFGYERNPRHGKLAVFSQPEIEGLIDQLIETGYLKVVGSGRLPVLRLTGRGEAALSCRAAIPLTFPRQVTKAVKPREHPSNHQTINDPVTAYLSRSHPRPLAGPWRVGWALGFHSSFAGSDWSRSGVGELVFALKYRNDGSALEPLVEEALSLCREHPDLIEADAIIPVPPSTLREVDPVTVFCEVLGERLKLPVLPCVTRTRPTKPQKEMRTLAQKRANVAGAFSVTQAVTRRRVLLIDDLYDSGATLEEVARALIRAGAASIRVLTLTRTIHSDA